MRRITRLADLIIDDEWQAWAAAHAPSADLYRELDRYRDWLASRGKSHRDYGAGFRNWLRRAEEWANEKRGHSPGGRRDATIAAILDGDTQD